MKFLVISLAGIGDTTFATPLIHELRANFPEATIDALVLWAGSRDILETNPNLNAVFQKNLIKTATPSALAFLRQLGLKRYDISINTHPQSRIHYRVVARFINARQRFSHRYDNSSFLDSFLVNRTIAQDYNKHSIENNLAFLDLLGTKPRLPEHDYELYLKSEEHTWAEEYIAAQGLKERVVLGVHVGSGGTKNLALRRWPLSHYDELFEKLRIEQRSLAVLLFGGKDEEQDHKMLMKEGRNEQLFEPRPPTIRHAAALIKRCHFFLSVDTSLMHVAAAMKVPKQIVIETPTWNTPIRPYKNPYVLIRNPGVNGRNLDFYRYDGKGIHGSAIQLAACMESVTVDSVYKAITSNAESVMAHPS